MPHWRDFPALLQGRALHGVKMIANDAHAGLREAQNAMVFVPKVSMRKEVGASLRAVFDAPYFQGRIYRRLVALCELGWVEVGGWVLGAGYLALLAATQLSF